MWSMAGQPGRILLKDAHGGLFIILINTSTQQHHHAVEFCRHIAKGAGHLNKSSNKCNYSPNCISFYLRDLDKAGVPSK